MKRGGCGKVLAAVTALALLSGCSLEEISNGALAIKGWLRDGIAGSRAAMLSMRGIEKIREARREEIMEAINNQDGDAIYEMFAPNAQEDVENLSEQIEDLLSYIDGPIENWDPLGGYSSNRTYEGNRGSIYSTEFYADTADSQYVIGFEEYLVDRSDSDNVGLRLILITTKEDFDSGDIHYYPTTPGVRIFLGDEDVWSDGAPNVKPSSDEEANTQIPSDDEMDAQASPEEAAE